MLVDIYLHSQQVPLFLAKIITYFYKEVRVSGKNLTIWQVCRVIKLKGEIDISHNLRFEGLHYYYLLLYQIFSRKRFWKLIINIVLSIRPRPSSGLMKQLPKPRTGLRSLPGRKHLNMATTRTWGKT